MVGGPGQMGTRHEHQATHRAEAGCVTLQAETLRTLVNDEPEGHVRGAHADAVHEDAHGEPHLDQCRLLVQLFW